MKLCLIFCFIISLNCIQYEEYDYEEFKKEHNFNSTDYTDQCLPSDKEMEEFFSKNQIDFKGKLDKNIRFIAGKCNPIVLIPGIYSTKLNVKIKCKNLYRDEKDLYYKIKFYCGKFVCSSKTDNDENRYLWFNIGRDGFTMYRHPWEFNKELEEDEFQSTEDIWEWDNLYGSCLGYFMKMFDNEEECPIIQSSKKKICGHSHNIRIAYHGGFLNEIKEAQCGVRPVSNIMESNLNIATKDLSATNIFGELAKGLVDMGYKKGFSLSAVPYDFRRFIATNEFAFDALKYHIERMYSLTGKPVVIIAHSFGNLITLNALTKLSNEENFLKKIKKWISLAPPFAGATKAIDNFLYGTDDFNVDTLWKGMIEFERFGQSLMIRSVPTVYELKPFKIFWNIFNSNDFYTEFAEAIRERLELEKICHDNKNADICNEQYIRKNSVKFDEIYGDYFPSFTQSECAIERSIGGNQNALSKKCFTQILNIVDYPTLIRVKDQTTDYNIERYHQDSGENIYYVAECDEIKYSKCVEDIFFETKSLNETFPDELDILIRRFYNIYDKKIDISDNNYFDTPEEEKEKIKEMIDHQNNISLIKELPIPPVDIDIVYSSYNPTLVAEFIDDYDLSLRSKVEKGGDGTVPTWSTLLTAFKWIYEKEKNNSTQNIRLVEYCSRIDDTKLNINNFKAISCRCIENNVYNKDLDKCSHQNMLGDEKNLFFYIYDEINKDNENIEAKKTAINDYSSSINYEDQCNSKLYMLSTIEKKIKCDSDQEITSEEYNDNYCGKQNYATMKGRNCCSVHIHGKNCDDTKYDSYFCDNIKNNDDSIEEYKDYLIQEKAFYEEDNDVQVEVICSSSYLNFMKVLLLLLFYIL